MSDKIFIKTEINQSFADECLETLKNKTPVGEIFRLPDESLTKAATKAELKEAILMIFFALNIQEQRINRFLKFLEIEHSNQG